MENSCLPKYIYIKIVVKTFTCQITHIDILDSATFGLNVRPDLIIQSIILLHTLVFRLSQQAQQKLILKRA